MMILVSISGIFLGNIEAYNVGETFNKSDTSNKTLKNK